MERESKTCARCGRVMEFRKKWEKNWHQVKFCSERCRRSKSTDTYEADILALLQQRGRDKTICPSEVLAAEFKQNHEKMESVRQAARRLAGAGKIQITQNGRTVDPSSFKGPIRLKLTKEI